MFVFSSDTDSELESDEEMDGEVEENVIVPNSVNKERENLAMSVSEENDEDDQ